MQTLSFSHGICLHLFIPPSPTIKWNNNTASPTYILNKAASTLELSDQFEFLPTTSNILIYLIQISQTWFTRL